jgi:hypothetical protein
MGLVGDLPSEFDAAQSQAEFVAVDLGVEHCRKEAAGAEAKQGRGPGNEAGPMVGDKMSHGIYSRETIWFLVVLVILTLQEGDASQWSVLPRAISCQAFSLKGRIPMDRGTKLGNFTQKGSFVEQ